MTYANAWVVAVDGARRRLPGWAALLIAVAVIGASLFGGEVLYGRLAPPLSFDFVATALDTLLHYACDLGLFYIAAVLGVRFGERRAALIPSTSAPFAALGGAGLGAIFFLTALGLVAALHAVRPGASSLNLFHRSAGPAALALLMLFQVGAEEVFFRGWLQPVLAARWGPWVGLMVTSLLFAGAHAVMRPLTPVAFVNDTLAGVGFGLLALRTGGLAAPIAAHWAWNWTEAAIVGATPNPGVDRLGALFDLDLVGPPLVAGGADEMNGSLCATVALAGLIACAALWRPRRIWISEA